MLVLEGQSLYEGGKKIGPLNLAEGCRSEKMVIVEHIEGSCLMEVPIEDVDRKSILQMAEARHLQTSGVPLILKGRFQLADTKNANSRIYPSALWDKILADKSIMQRVAHGEMLSECDHPKSGETTLERCAGMVTHFERNPDNSKEIIGRMAIFDTPLGRTVRAIIEGGGRVGVSSRGSGSVVRVDGSDVVGDDFELQTWDCVTNPSTPGAYPDIETESKIGVERHSKESVSMPLLQDLVERFDRIRNRDLSILSRDAVEIIKEATESIRNDLTKTDFGKDSPKAAMLAVDVASFQSKLAEVKSEIPRHADLDMPEKCDKSAWDKAKKAASKSDYKDKGALTKHIYKKITGESIEASLPRAATANETSQILKAIYNGPRADLEETSRAARSAYIAATSLTEGLSREEIDGIVRFASEAVSAPVKEALVRAKVKKSDGTIEEKQFKSEDELYEAFSGRDIVIVDASRDEIYEEAAKKFQPLLEAQTLKAHNAVTEMAKLKSNHTALSAKVAAAIQVIENLGVRVRTTYAQKDLAEKNLIAAKELIRALVEETGIEKMRGAVTAIASTHPHLPNLIDRLAETRSLQEAITLTKKLMIENLTVVPGDREPVSDKKVTEAIKKSAEATAEAERRVSGGDSYGDSRARGLGELTENVVSLMRSRGVGR